MSCADAMATPASNAAVLSNSCFLMESFLLFTVPRAGPNALRLTGKRSSHRCSSDRTGGFPPTGRRPFETSSVEPDRRKLFANYTGQLCEIRAASQPTPGSASQGSLCRAATRGCAARSASVNQAKVRREVKRACLLGLGCFSRTLSPLFGSLREAFVVFGDPQHRVLGIGVAHLLGDGAGLFCALSPMRRVIDEGCRHLCARVAVGARSPAASGFAAATLEQTSPRSLGISNRRLPKPVIYPKFYFCRGSRSPSPAATNLPSSLARTPSSKVRAALRTSS
jgi:hypothetical protein